MASYYKDYNEENRPPQNVTFWEGGGQILTCAGTVLDPHCYILFFSACIPLHKSEILKREGGDCLHE